MHIKSQRDFVSGLLFIGVGVACAVGASTYPMGSSAVPGAGFFPLVLAVVLMVLGTAVLFKSLTIETEGGDPIGPIAWRPVVAILGAVVGFGLGLERIGLLMAVPILVLVASLAARPFGWRGAVVSAALLTAACWGLSNTAHAPGLPWWPAPGR
ncbi:MAG: tripartite tricarboxylate transporter TctB family protein [Pseudomonadota bacterium]|nr:tripartite tricarboxylate transporter TctB family protein [Pseudomonadota bacterium]MDP9167972.1 tripartite tricarboxylate transporter TctB family protein [Actinomycetota bacterium]